MFSYQSCVNRTETVHVEPCVSCFYSHPLYGMCVKIFIMNWYISKSYTAIKNTIDRQYTEREKLLQLCQLLLINNCVWRVRLMVPLLSPSFQLMDASFARVHCHHHHLYSSLGGITLNFLHNIVLTTLFACLWVAVCFRVTCILIFSRWRHFVWLLTAECNLTQSLACLF